MNMRLASAVLAAGLAAATAGFAPPPAAPAKPAAAAKPHDQCFWASNITNYAADNDREINIRVGVHDYYQLKLMGPCPDVDWPHRIAIISRTGGTICGPLDAVIAFHSDLGPQRCYVRSVRRLTPQEYAALSKRAQP